MTAAGDPVPDFDLPTSSGDRLTAAGLRGHRTLLYFYPKDSTTGCTLEAREFSELRPEFEKRGVTVYGVSPDSLRRHAHFIDSCDLSLTLVSDEARELCEGMGVWVEKSMYGRTYMGVERSTFLVGPEGTVERAWRRVSPRGHARDVLEAI